MARAKKNKKNKPAKGPSLAQRADKHVLYEQSVQCVEAEIDFVDATFAKLRGRKARKIREDFCGTANSSCEWVKRRHDNIAYSVDLDPEVLEWAKLHNISKLSAEQAARLNTIEANVLEVDVKSQALDAVLAMNFSYWLFKQRATMLAYFTKVHAALADDGVFFLDSFGGYEAFREMEESTRQDGFTYIWDQSRYNPITGDGLFYIHFKFRDGSRLDRAFSYDWRIWTLPEIQEILIEAGFTPAIYWEGTDEDGDGNGVFEETRTGEADAGWIAYIVATK